MSHRKLVLEGLMGTRIRLYLDGPHAGDMVELWRALRDFTVGLEKEIKPKMEALGTTQADLIAEKKPGEAQ